MYTSINGNTNNYNELQRNWTGMKMIQIPNLQGFFYTPYFFLYTPRPIWVGNPPWGVKSRTDAEAAPGISWIGLILFAGATPANPQQQRTHTVFSWPTASLIVSVPWHDTHPVARRLVPCRLRRHSCCRCYAYTHAHPHAGAAAAC